MLSQVSADSQLPDRVKALLTEQIVLAKAVKISWTDSNQMLVPERLMVLRILHEMNEAQKQQVETVARGARMRMHR